MSVKQKIAKTPEEIEVLKAKAKAAKENKAKDPTQLPKSKEPKQLPKAKQQTQQPPENDNCDEKEEDDEFCEPVIKRQTTGNLESCKRAYTNKDFETFKKEIVSGKFQLFEAKYKYSDDYDGCNELFVRNRIGGIKQNLDKNRNYYFVALKCLKETQSDKQCYKFESYWIVNTDLKDLMKDDYDDHNWILVDVDKYEDFITKFSSDCEISTYVH